MKMGEKGRVRRDWGDNTAGKMRSQFDGSEEEGIREGDRHEEAEEEEKVGQRERERERARARPFWHVAVKGPFWRLVPVVEYHLPIYCQNKLLLSPNGKHKRDVSTDRQMIWAGLCCIVCGVRGLWPMLAWTSTVRREEGRRVSRVGDGGVVYGRKGHLAC